MFLCTSRLEYVDTSSSVDTVYIAKNFVTMMVIAEVPMSSVTIWS